MLNVIPQGGKLTWLISEWLDFLTNTCDIGNMRHLGIPGSNKQMLLF